MSSEKVLTVSGVSKCFELYDQPRDRLLQFLARGRRQYFRELWALRDIAFEVARGESIGLIGQNGSGKSTLLQIVTGTLAPSSGTVQIQGRVAALLELGAGFNVEFTGRENVYMNAAILGVPRERMAARMDQVLEFSELGEFIDRPVKTYSSGMYARLAFSAAIHVDPEVLIVDETLSVGDARFVAKCMRRIHELKERGVSVVFVSHDVTAVRALCERAIWINKGRLIEDGEVFPVTGRYMEFMFRDDESVAAAVPVPVRVAPAADPTHVAPDPGSDDLAVLPCAEAAPAAPVTHWGSHKGIIRSAVLRDPGGVARNVCEWGAIVDIVVQLRVPPEIPRENLSVAISLKDLRGSDLMVSTTHDRLDRTLPDGLGFEVTFRFPNLLTPGKYLLVAAVERRQGADIYYYEYVEGALYFASVSEGRMFGIFRPQVQQFIRGMDALEL